MSGLLLLRSFCLHAYSWEKYFGSCSLCSKVIIIARRVWMIPLTTPTLLQRRRLGSLLAFAWLGLILFPCPSLDTISRSTSAYFYGDASRAAVFRAQPSVPATLNKRSRRLCYAGETTTFLWLTFCVKLQWIHVFRSSKCRMLKRIPSLEVEHQHIPKMDRVVTDHWCSCLGLLKQHLDEAN